MSEDHATTDYEPGHDMFLSTDSLTHWRGCDAVHPDCVHPAVAILSDLIAELRGVHRMTQDEWHGELLPDKWCLECRNRDGDLVGWPCQTIDTIDQAEARLNAITHSDTPTTQPLDTQH